MNHLVALNKYIERKNTMAKLFKTPSYDISNPAHRRDLAERVSGDLSPENLSCDGECSRAEVNRKYRHLNAVKADLLSLDPSLKFYE
jgi:hypothetical protein